MFGENELFVESFAVFSLTDFVYSKNNKRLNVLSKINLAYFE